MLVTPSRTANGEAMPSSVIGTEKISMAAKNEPRKAPTDASANAPTARSSSGSAMNGMHRDGRRRDQHQPGQVGHVGMAVGQPAAQEVARRTGRSGSGR